MAELLEPRERASGGPGGDPGGDRRLAILRHEPEFVAISKPPGFHVHQPERPRPRVPSERTCLAVLRDQIGRRVHPVHRLDVATGGALLFALTSEAASGLGRAFSEGRVEKTYYAVVRGWVPLGSGVIDLPLKSDSSDLMVEARTAWAALAHAEFPDVILGKRRLPARFTLMEAKPVTGRFHQIRRHFARLSHPIVGDSAHGDSRQNQFMRDRLGARGLLLHARRLAFPHPRTGERVDVVAPWAPAWQVAAPALGWESWLSRL